MRAINLVSLASFIVVCGAAADAQTPVPSPVPAPQAQAGTASAIVSDIGEIDFGFRLTGGLDEVGRYQRFEDRRSGPALDRVLYVRDRPAWTFNANADHVGYRDQHYFAEVDRYGKVRATFEWNQVPLLYSRVSKSPFGEENSGVFRLDDTIQSAVQNRTATLASYGSALRQFDTRSRRDVADLRFVYSATRDVDLMFGWKSTRRTGSQPWGASFGFSNDTEVPVPLDHRTNDLNTAAEWSNPRGMVRVAYDGSWFNNSVETLVWDNPLRFTDTTNSSAYSTGEGTSQGRMALWPDSTAHTVSASGSVALPARSRAFGYVSVGSWLQDAQLLPHTINTAIQPIPLPRATAEAEARIVSMNYRVTSRPTPMVWLSGQFRLYDYDNRTPHFAVTDYVRLDETLSTSVTGGSEPFGYTRHFVDLDASFTPLRFTAFRVGYAQQHDDRTFRFLDETTDHTVRASIDSTGFAWGSARLQYDHSVRTGKGFDEEALSEIGEQVSLRQFDISDRTRDRVSAILQVVPSNIVGFTATVATGREHRPDAAFGLQDNDLRAVTVGADLTPGDFLGASASYAFENYSTLQRSRQANPGVQFNDPTRDWSTDVDENVHTITLTFDLPQITSRTAVHLGYDYVHSNAEYLYLLPSNSTLTTPQQLPPVVNAFHRLNADVRYTITKQLAVSAGYLLDTYDVRDFALGPDTLTTPLIPTFLNTNYQWRPYDVHTGFLRLLYRW